MKEGNVIEVRNVTKKFKVFMDKGHTLKEMTLFRSRRQYQDREVLKGISFELKKGEAIGLIGQNGCGKSTTLKLLTRIMYPDTGAIEMSGRVSSLIELGAGFHPDMSGRQNIYTNASIFGLTRKEIEKRLDDIITFSELREFIDNPVRTYSSGMYMRLAFAVAINVDADILLIDEILAVGDAAFQAKCFNRLREIKAAGTTIVIVSHSMGQIEQICDRAIWIKDGEIEEEGAPRNVIQTYMAWIMEGDKFVKPEENEKDTEDKDIQEKRENANETDKYEYTASDILELKKSGKCIEIGNHDVEIVDYEILDAATLKRKKRFLIGESVLCRIIYKRNNPDIKETMCSFSIYRSDGLNCYSTNSFINTGDTIKLQNNGVIEFVIQDNPFMQGEYKMDLSLNKDYGPTYHGYINACSFEVYNVTTDYGICRPNIRWKTEQRELEQIISVNNINEKNYRSSLKIKEVLELDDTVGSLERIIKKEYDLIVISDSVYDIQKKNDFIRVALDMANYLILKNDKVYGFEKKIGNSIVFATDKGQEVLIPLSTKNKELISEAVAIFENRDCKNDWLLNCFREKAFFFEVVRDEVAIKANLISKDPQTITLLDEGIAFGYRAVSEEKKEGARVEIRRKVYPGDNLYILNINEKIGSKVEISIVKEGEYWLDNILPECVEVIEL